MSTQHNRKDLPATADQPGLHVSESIQNMDDTSRDAARAASAEHSMTLMQGLRLYPRAVLWSVIISTTIVMEGFDKVLIPSLFASPPFAKTFGQRLPDGSYQLTASWQSGLSLASTCGEIVGLGLNGVLADRFGYRKVMIGALVLVTCFIFIVFFAKDAGQLLAGQVLLGIPWGVFQTLPVTYASEVCPVPLRAYLTTYINLCWVFGQLIASGVLRGVLSRNDEWNYRIPFALQWIWPLPIIVGMLLAPESPWWLIRKGRRDDARKTLLRLASPAHDQDFDVDATIALMERTNQIEKEMVAGTSYADCFRGTNLRRTEIACLTWLSQIWSGVALMGYSTYFYNLAGLSVEHSFTMTMVQYAIGFAGTLISWVMMAHFGRRTLYLAGLSVIFVLMIATGCIGATAKGTGAGWAAGSMILAFTMVYDITVGPVCYSLVAELTSTRLRAKTVVLARCVYNAGAIVIYVLTPYMLNPAEWNWGAKTGFFWAGVVFCSTCWVFFRLPEPKARTYGELDALFERRLSARMFKSAVVDVTELAGAGLGKHGKAEEHVHATAVGIE